MKNIPKTIAFICAVPLLPLLASATVIDFKKLGYPAGSDLANSDEWSGGTGNQVTEDGLIQLAPEPWRVTSWNEPFTIGNEYKVTAKARFTFKEAQAKGSNSVIGIVMSTSLKNSTQVRFYLNRSGKMEAYSLMSHATDDRIQSKQLNSDAIGIRQTGDTSDPLEMAVTLIRGKHKSDWTLKMVLKNLKTQAEVLSVEQSGLTYESDFFETDEIYFGLSSCKEEAGTGTAERKISYLEGDSVSTHYVAVPEPKNYALVTAGLAMLCAVVRRRVTH